MSQMLGLSNYFRSRKAIQRSPHAWLIGLAALLAGFSLAGRLEAQVQSGTGKTPRRVLQSRWELEPDLDVIWLIRTPKQPVLVDIAAVKSTSLEERVATMQKIVLDAEYGYKNQPDALEAVLESLAGEIKNDSKRSAKLATLSAALKLATNLAEAERVWAVAEGDPIAKQAEKSMKAWKSKLPLQRWRDRLQDSPGIYDVNGVMLAIDGIGAAGDATDRDLLVEELFDSNSSTPVQLNSAKALGALVAEGQEELAKSIRADESVPDWFRDLLAAEILQKHRTPETIEICQSILAGECAPARHLALKTIARTDLELGMQLAAKLIQDEESSIRLASVKILQQSDEVRDLNLQAQALTDPNSNIRTRVRQNLQAKSKNPELSSAINDIIGSQLRSERWEGIEQAIQLSIYLRQHERVPVLTGLLTHPRAEVKLWAAWAMQQLKQTPESLDAIHRQCQTMTQRIAAEEFLTKDEVLATAFLFEALGSNRYMPASEMLMLYVPKQDQLMRATTRCSAIFALGLIWEQEKNPKLAKSLVQRMLDDGDNPDEDTVRYASATSVGRVGSAKLIPQFQRLIDEAPPNQISIASAWAAEQLQSAEK
ncbi:MAG: hypothetical protein AAF483_01480 [Planctomycetota bacterium]